MFRSKVMPFAGSPRRQGTIDRKLPSYLLILSALGALGSVGGLIWTYAHPAAFTANVANADGSLLAWIPKLPFIASLAALAIGVRLFTDGPNGPRRSSVYSRASRIFEVGVWDVPFVAGFVAAGICFLTPVFSAVLTLGPTENSALIGCGIARFCFSVLAISHLGHAAYAGWGFWNRRGLP
jgi:hypothetical protein